MTIHKLLLPFLALFLFSACSNDGPVAGSWILDGGATSTAIDALFETQMKGKTGAEAEMGKAVLNGFKEAMKKMRSEIDIAADGTFKIHNDTPGKHEHIDGKWTLQGNTITFTGKSEGQDKEETHSGTIDGDVMRVEQSQGGQKMTMVFRRKK